MISNERVDLHLDLTDAEFKALEEREKIALTLVLKGPLVFAKYVTACKEAGLEGADSLVHNKDIQDAILSKLEKIKMNTPFLRSVAEWEAVGLDKEIIKNLLESNKRKEINLLEEE